MTEYAELIKEVSTPLIFVNLLGDWTLLSPESEINGKNNQNYIDCSELFTQAKLVVKHNEKLYHIHPSLIQVVTGQ